MLAHAYKHVKGEFVPMNHRPLIATATIILAIGLVWFAQSANGSPSLALARPVFADTQPTSSFLDDEAGIAGYAQLPAIADFAYVRGLYRTIERETDDYIIGSIPVDPYRDTEDMHVYIHQNGWIVAYYMNDYAAGRLIDWANYDGTGIPTKSENIINQVADALQVAHPAVSYYDFRYPEATHMMVIAKRGDNATYRLNVPSDFVYYEQGWAHGSDGNWSSGTSTYYYLDGEQINWTSGSYWTSDAGVFTSQQFLPDIYHTVELSDGGYYTMPYAAVVLLYKETP